MPRYYYEPARQIPITRDVDVLVEVVEVPAPLLAVDLDDDVGVLLERGDRVDVPGRVDEHHADHEDRQDDVHDLERHVVPELDRQHVVVLALAVDGDAPQDEPPHDEADRERGDPRAGPQGRDALGHVGDLAVRVAGQEAAADLLGRAPAQQCGAGDHRRRGEDPRSASAGVVHADLTFESGRGGARVTWDLGPGSVSLPRAGTGVRL